MPPFGEDQDERPSEITEAVVDTTTTFDFEDYEPQPDSTTDMSQDDFENERQTFDFEDHDTQSDTQSDSTDMPYFMIADLARELEDLHNQSDQADVPNFMQTDDLDIDRPITIHDLEDLLLGTTQQNDDNNNGYKPGDLTGFKLIGQINDDGDYKLVQPDNSQLHECSTPTDDLVLTAQLDGNWTTCYMTHTTKRNNINDVPCFILRLPPFPLFNPLVVSLRSCRRSWIKCVR